MKKKLCYNTNAPNLANLFLIILALACAQVQRALGDRYQKHVNTSGNYWVCKMILISKVMSGFTETCCPLEATERSLGIFQDILENK